MPICVSCKYITDKIRGSAKYPFCPKCFKEKFNDDIKAYEKELKEHLK